MKQPHLTDKQIVEQVLIPQVMQSMVSAMRGEGDIGSGMMGIIDAAAEDGVNPMPMDKMGKIAARIGRARRDMLNVFPGNITPLAAFMAMWLFLDTLVQQKRIRVRDGSPLAAFIEVMRSVATADDFDIGDFDVNLYASKLDHACTNHGLYQ